MLSEKDDIRDRIRGLEAGADDYLTWQSLETGELIERIRVILVHHSSERQKKIKIVD